MSQEKRFLLKPEVKTSGKQKGHTIGTGKSNGLCAFTAALQIAKGGSALAPDAATMNGHSVGELARREFMIIRLAKSIDNDKEFATLLQVAALHEQIAAQMYRKDKAAQKKASRYKSTHKRSACLIGYEAVSESRDQMDVADGADHISSAMQESLKAETEFHAQMFERISHNFLEEEVRFGTWVPVWVLRRRCTCMRYHR